MSRSFIILIVKDREHFSLSNITLHRKHQNTIIMSDTQSIYWTELDPAVEDSHPIRTLMKECGCTRQRAIDLLNVSHAPKIPKSYIYKLFVTDLQ